LVGLVDTPHTVSQAKVSVKGVAVTEKPKVIPLTSAKVKVARLELAGNSPADLPVLQPAQIHDHDNFRAVPTKSEWPSNLAPSTLKLHLHFCELVDSWNLNPFRRDTGVAAVDQFAETQGISRFSFTSKIALDDFLDYNLLDDFIVSRNEASRSDAFHFVTLTNKFLPSEIEAYFTIYREAMESLTVLEEERHRAIRMDANKVGYVTIDHFCARETHELMRIKRARSALGASGLARNS
jgi:hypothetical protein